MTSLTGMDEFTERCINTIRLLCVDMVQKAKSGHPGAPLGLAPTAYLLWKRIMNYNPTNPNWPNRDRFVLSNGHACALLYSMLHLTGYKDWTMDDLMNFRQLQAKTAGHPECFYPGIEVTSGPLGQGIASGIGMAIAEAHMAARFNKPGFPIVDHYTYIVCGDGCLMEGITSEACSLAGHLGLDKLIVIYDSNNITIDGSTDLAFTENVLKRFEAYGWHTQEVENGDTDIEGLFRAIQDAKVVKGKPHFIKLSTTIGYGSKNRGKSVVHGAPLEEDDVKNLKKMFGFDQDKTFVVPDDVRKALNHVTEGQKLESEWTIMFDEYKKQYKDLAEEFERRLEKRLPEGWEDCLPREFDPSENVATRKLSGNCVNALAGVLPELIGGSADLNPSCLTYIKSEGDFQRRSYDNRNIRFGVREHAMIAILTGLSRYGGFIPYGSTFLNFIGYAYGAVAIAALSKVKALYIMTHDSIGLGEDGPTHQAIEKLMLIRETPNIRLFRPCDGRETTAAYIAAIRAKDEPTVIALTRQTVPLIEGSSIEEALKGAYILPTSDDSPDLILVATGSEVQLISSAKAKLNEQGLKVRLVSFPCWELFEMQPQGYKETVFTPGVPVLSVEAGSMNGWSKYAHASIGMSTFGATGPYQKVMEKFGFDTKNIVEKAKRTVEFYKTHPVAHLVQRPF